PLTDDSPDLLPAMRAAMEKSTDSDQLSALAPAHAAAAGRRRAPSLPIRRLCAPRRDSETSLVRSVQGVCGRIDDGYAAWPLPAFLEGCGTRLCGRSAPA